VSNGRKAFVVIDVQNDFLPGGALAVAGGDAIIPVINALQTHFPLVLATQDWHPPGHASFASSHPGKKPMDEGEVGGHRQTLWPDHCICGTTGAEFSPDLNTHRFESIFRKGTQAGIDSYSAFQDFGRHYHTGLADYLRGKGVETIYLAGLATDFCVYYTALDALREGFKTCVIRDATRSVDFFAGDGERALEDIIAKGGMVLQSDQVQVA